MTIARWRFALVAVLIALFASMTTLAPSGAGAQGVEAPDELDAESFGEVLKNLEVADDFDVAEPAIINGTPAAPNEFPFMGAFLSLHPNDLINTCGGSLIAETWFLTAAHCTTYPLNSDDPNFPRQLLGRPVPPEDMLFGFGGTNLQEVGQITGALQVIRHPDYDPLTLRNDVALIRLDQPANLDHPGIGLIALNESATDPIVRAPLFVAGWGATTVAGGPISQVALKAVVPTTSCDHPLGPQRPHNLIEICSVHPSLSGVCFGDSGGPAIQRYLNVNVLVGVISSTIGPVAETRSCGVTSIFARVSAFVPWIKSVTRERFVLCNDRPVEHFMDPGVPYIGTEGPDVVLGTAGNDRVFAGGGDDAICTGDGNDLIVAGAGSDSVDSGQDVDRIYGEGGIDYLLGQGGSDRIYGGPGADIVLGGSGADRLRGGPGNDDLRGMGGQDFMWGEEGNDILQGNWQSDRLWGGPGNDRLAGAQGKDKLYGGAGNDSLFGGNNTDYLNGGAGNDNGHGQRGKDNPLIPGVSGCEQLETKASC